MSDFICWLLGHKWVFDRNLPGPEKGWWYEYSKCSRCKAISREVIASITD